MRRIMIIDDAEDASADMQHYISNLPPGTVALHFRSGVAAISYLRNKKKEPIDLILLDQNFNYGHVNAADGVKSKSGGFALVDFNKIQFISDPNAKILILKQGYSDEQVVQQQGVIILAALKKELRRVPPVIFCCTKSEVSVAADVTEDETVDYIGKDVFEKSLSRILLKKLPSSTVSLEQLVRKIALEKELELERTAEAYLIRMCSMPGVNSEQYVSEVCTALKNKSIPQDCITVGDLRQVVAVIEGSKRNAGSLVDSEVIRIVEERMGKLVDDGFSFMAKVSDQCDSIISVLKNSSPSFDELVLICGQIIEIYSFIWRKDEKLFERLSYLKPPLPCANIGLKIWEKRNKVAHPHPGFSFKRKEALVIVNETLQFLESCYDWEKSKPVK